MGEFNMKRGKYFHECMEWDGLEIDETSHEFIVCECFEDSKEIQEFKTKLKKEALEEIQSSSKNIGKGHRNYQEGFFN